MAKVPFNVDAYTAKLIGRENVSKLDGAVLELVKNTYDADASVCVLYYDNSKNTLYIADNGTGMTEDIILKHWMTIGSSTKKTNFTTNKGRIQTGAKGIGRFALDRIADNCSLLTISEKEHLLWNVDWNVFEFGQKITDITAELEKSDTSFQEFFKNIPNKEFLDFVNNHFPSTGSVFKLQNLRESWDESVITSITTNLRTLIPPEFKDFFNIYFFENDTRIEDAALLQESHVFSYDYRIKFSTQEDGRVKIEIDRDEFDFGTDFDKITTEAGFDKKEKSYFKHTPIIIETNFTDVLRSKYQIENTIGDFEGVFYYAKIKSSKSDREKYYYKDITGRPDIRDSFGGVRIYRDGFRVRPYGDPKSTALDWLMLAKRKNKSPAAITHESGAWRVNGDQIHGSIYISRINITLPDQANRQGIVETKEFLLLQQFLQNVLRYFEQDRQNVFRKLLAYYEKTHPTAEIQREIQDKLKENLKRKKESENTKSDYKPALIEVEKASALLEEKEKEIKQLETELNLLRVLATTGIVTNTYIHEIKEITHKLSMKIIMAQESLQFDNDVNTAKVFIKEADELRNNFTSWFKVTVDSVRRDKRTMHQTNIHDLVSALLSDWQMALKPKNIEINSKIDNITFKCFPYEIESILSNLITNSSASFDNNKVENKTINVVIESIDNGIIIKYHDTGDGLLGEYKKKPWLILEPFESDKRSANGEMIGTGMGMWILNRIVMEYNGSIDLSENQNQLKGFYITLRLNSKV
jgi:signal transduction histidine kinase